jgi:hypothetical protein
VTIPGGFNISGSVASELGPLHDAAVRVSIAGHEYEQMTSESGGFRVLGSLPPALNLGGPAEFSITVLPREPWHMPITETHRLITANLISVGVVAAVLMVGIAGVVTQLNRRPLAVALPEAPAAAMEALARIRTDPAATSLKGPLQKELVSVYTRVLRRLEAAFGIHADVTKTLREFARLLPVRAAADPFWRLTKLVELAAYSPDPITPAQVEQARVLGTELEGAVSGAQ